MSTLVFSIGLNGYGNYYRRCVASHRAWCKRNGYTYVMVDQPAGTHEAALAAWLKVPVLLAGLEQGHDHVVYLDADVEVRPSAPSIDGLTDDAHPIRMADGRTGRLNSGVIVARNTEPAREFLREVQQSITEDISDEARANLKYENGNIIFVASRTNTVGPLDVRWNNTYDSALDDYARHYTGSLRDEFRPALLDAVVRRLRSRKTGRWLAAPSSRTEEFAQRLAALSSAAVASTFPSTLVR